MSHQTLVEVARDTFRIETGLYRPGLAACYLLRSGERLAFVDTGTAHTVPSLLATVAGLGLTPEARGLRDPHPCPSGSCGRGRPAHGRLPERLADRPPRAAPHLIDPARLTAGATAVYGEEAFARDFGTLEPVAEARVTLAEDGETIDLAGRTLTFIDTPGHANHHFCVQDSSTGGCFTGDTFGIAYQELVTDRGPWIFAPTTPVAFDPDAWESSLDRLMATQPSAMFLTHYGRVDRPETLVEPLRRSIRYQSAIALAEEGQPDPARADRLRAAIGTHLRAGARAHGVTLDETRLGELLAVDTELNAQGLEVWLKRRERRAAAG